MESVDSAGAMGLTPFAMRRFHTGFLVAAIAIGQLGCAKMIAGSTARVMNQAWPANQAFADLQDPTVVTSPQAIAKDILAPRV